MIGSTVSHYRVLRKIGEGGMGEVFLAEDLKLRREVALKFLAAHWTRDPDRKARFLQEARAAAAIEHPHVAVVHEIDEADGRTFIAMEYVRGESLRDALLRGSLGASRAVELALQIAGGLELAHSRGIVHRDLKPENVLLSERGDAKIIDFGLAKLLESAREERPEQSESATLLKTRDGIVMGTAAYMSPEQARAVPVDARTDLFSLGVILHEMISGESPFLRAGAVETLHAVLHDQPPVRDVAPSVERLLKRALAKDPAERYQTAADLASDLREARSALASGGPRSGRRRWLWAAAAIAIAVAVALLTRAILPAGPAPGIGASGRPAITALSFENHSNDDALGWLSHGLPGMLLTGLAQTPGLDVISTRKVDETIASDSDDPASGFSEAARRAGAGAIVTGSIYKSGDELRLDVRVEDLESGRLLAAESVRGTDVFRLADELTARVRESLQVSDRPEGRPLRDVTTSSLDAYRRYSEGVEARHNIRHADARRLLEEAVAIDPSFAMAHFHLSAIATTLGETALRDEHHRKAMENLDRLPERHALLVRSSDAALRGRIDEATAVLEKLLALYPDEEEGYDLYVHLLGDQPEAVLAVLDRWAGAVPGPGSGHFHNHRGYALLQVGRYDEAFRAFEAYARVRPDEANPYDSMGDLHLTMGRPDQALEWYGKALVFNSSFGPSMMGRVWANGMLGRYDDLFAGLARLDELGDLGLSVYNLYFIRAFALSRVGRLAEASETIRIAAALATRAGNRDAWEEFQLLSAWIRLENSENALALETIEKTGFSPPASASTRAERENGLVAQLLAGVAEARSGRLDSARARLSDMGTPAPEKPAETWYRQALAGEISLASGNPDDAEIAFATGEPERKMWSNFNQMGKTTFANGLPFRDGLARAAAARGDKADAISRYQALLTADEKSRWTAFLEPRFVLQLARLLESSGERSEARREYLRFLDLWKDADPGLDELREARAAAKLP